MYLLARRPACEDKKRRLLLGQRQDRLVPYSAHRRASEQNDAALCLVCKVARDIEGGGVFAPRSGI
jgi:hypothetical protein